MARFAIHRFIPELNRGVAVAIAPDANNLFSRFWVRRMTPSDGGMNWSLGSQQLPRFSLSGPQNYNARQFKPLEPAHPYTTRRIVSLNAYGNGRATGQFISAPLVGDNGGITKQLYPTDNRPFDIFGIRPAGRA